MSVVFLAYMAFYSSNGTSINLGLDTSENIIFSLAVDPIPEPTTILLLGLGLLGLMGDSRKKQ